MYTTPWCTPPPKSNLKPNLTVVKAPQNATTRNGIFIMNTRNLTNKYKPVGDPFMTTSAPFKRSWYGMHYDTTANKNALRMVTYGKKPGPGTVVANSAKLTKNNLNIIASRSAPEHLIRMKKETKIKSNKKYPSGLYTNLQLQPHQVLMFQGNATPHCFPVRRPNQKYKIYYGNYRNIGKSSLNKLRLATGYNWTLNELRHLENFFRAQRTPVVNFDNNNL